LSIYEGVLGDTDSQLILYSTVCVTSKGKGGSLVKNLRLEGIFRRLALVQGEGVTRPAGLSREEVSIELRGGVGRGDRSNCSCQGKRAEVRKGRFKGFEGEKRHHNYTPLTSEKQLVAKGGGGNFPF